MQIHGRAKLGPADRLAPTQAVMDGDGVEAGRGLLNVSPATAHRARVQALHGTRRGFGRQRTAERPKTA
jgi:hypothetical protein